MKLLFIANPIWDKTREVTENFIKENKLTKGMSQIQANAETFRDIWKKAKDSLVQAGQKEPTKIKGTCGGSGSNFMLPLSKLGYPCSILGRIGNDKRGEKIEKHYADLKVNSLLIKKTELPTGSVLCFITPDRERTMLSHLGTTEELTDEDIDRTKLKGYQHWHLEGYAFLDPELILKCIAIADENKATMSLNLPTKNVVKAWKTSFLEAAPHMSYIFGNLEEILTLAGFDLLTNLNPQDIQVILSTFPDYQTIAATDGANGCWIKAAGHHKAKHYDVPKIAGKITNKTGAGDIWGGIYLASSLQGKRVEECLEMANQGAAEWIQRESGKEVSEKTWEKFKKEIQRYLARI